ncbi:ThiF family adenylyltransferase [Actinoplanes sp. NPDC049118]|uniref:HesA/MoeB/ThiF family protein n=1 Tax=Actinoplanes sp. NPDC049118 TaxID=3155769 RepID=UPI0034006E2B
MSIPEDRFARQRSIDGWDQDRLAEATVVLAGVGALGTAVLQSLALAGVGRLIICDPDTVELTNLSRTVLFTPADVGRPKAEAAAARLAPLATGASVVPRHSDLTSGVGLGELADADLVIGCLDSIRARMQLLGRSALVGTNLLDGGTGPWSGEIRVRSDPAQPCYACSLTVVQRGVADLPRSCAEAQPEGHEPASIATTSVVAGWLTIAALRLLLGLPLGYHALRIDALGGTTRRVDFTRDPACPYHDPMSAVDRVLPVTHRDRVRDLISALPAGSDPLAWSEFPVTDVCRRCGLRLPPADAARPGVTPCPGCANTVVRRTGIRLAEADETRRLSDLGVAPQEILPVRDPDGVTRLLRLAV